MPIYEYKCKFCGKRWEEWVCQNDREYVFCCDQKADLLLSLGAFRANGITKEQPKIPKHEPFRSQIIKEGKKTINQSIPNSVIAETNRTIDKLNAKQGYKADD